MVQHPEVLWAQRSSESDEEKNILYITVNLPDIKASTLEYNLTPTSISFKAKAGSQEKEHAFDLEFFKEVVPEKSSAKLTSRSFNLILRKKDKQSEYWPRLTKEKVKNAFIKTDFGKWVDEDEQADAVEDAPEDMDPLGGMPGGMGAMGGMPGMGGMGGGMDFEKMMAQMGGMGGGMPDFSGAGPSGADENDDDDSDDDGPPPLEDAEPAK